MEAIFIENKTDFESKIVGLNMKLKKLKKYRAESSTNYEYHHYHRMILSYGVQKYNLIAKQIICCDCIISILKNEKTN